MAVKRKMLFRVIQPHYVTVEVTAAQEKYLLEMHRRMPSVSPKDIAAYLLEIDPKIRGGVPDAITEATYVPTAFVPAVIRSRLGSRE